MSFYNKGSAHKIAAMASKSCNAISPRDLYVPITVSDITTTDHGSGVRTYSATVTVSCYFGTRININNIFSDLSIDGVSVSSATINGWVSGTEPGKTIATATISGSYEYDGSPDYSERTIEVSGKMTYYTDIGCTKTKQIAFSNSIDITIDDIDAYYTTPATPTIDEVTSLDDALLIDVTTTSFGVGGGQYLYVEASKTADFSTIKQSTILGTLSGTVRLSNLQRNTNYYIRAVAANNGLSATSASQTTQTLAASKIDKITPESNTSATVTVTVFNGGGANSVSTQVQVSSDEGTTWTNVGSASSSKVPFSVTITGLTAGSTYQVRTVTTTSAGSSESDAVEYTSPSGLWGNVVSITSSGSDASVQFYANSTTTGTITATVYYRAYGMEEEWISAGSVTMSRDTVQSVAIENLIPNYAEYEVSINFVQGSKEFDTEPVQFFTIPLYVDNNTCDSLDYLVQLICQTLEAIKTGNITLFMNSDTKEWCEGEDGIPTIASIMSRVNRFMHAVGCILCSMEGFLNLLKEADTNQVFMGELGWVDCEDEVLDGSLNPVLSSAVFTAIQELIKQVWHYYGTYDYYGTDLTDLQSQTPTSSGATGLVDDKVYTWNGSSWGSATTIEPENFGVVHINSGTYADMAFYWFVDDWNRMDADTEDVEARTDALEEVLLVQPMETDEYNLAIVPYGYTDAQIASLVPTDATKDTIILQSYAPTTTGTTVEIIS